MAPQDNLVQWEPLGSAMEQVAPLSQQTSGSQRSSVGEPLGSATPLKPTYRIHTLPAKLLSDLSRQLVRVPTSPENISETGSNLQAVLSGTPKDPENIAQNFLPGTSRNPENVQKCPNIGNKASNAQNIQLEPPQVAEDIAKKAANA